MRLSMRLVPGSMLFALLMAGPFAVAFAQDPATPAPEPVAPPPDQLSGHLLIAPRVTYLTPLGSAENGVGQHKWTGSAPSFGLDLGFGISSQVALFARAEYAAPGRGGDCPKGGSCSAKTMGVGLGAEYHLVDGAAFDPWLQVGVGYRSMSYDLSWSGYNQTLKYQGIDWLHLGMGGDWYGTEHLGIGPYLSMDFGSYTSRPSGSTPLPTNELKGTSVHSFFSLGIRGVFDPMR